MQKWEYKNGNIKMGMQTWECKKDECKSENVKYWNVKNGSVKWECKKRECINGVVKTINEKMEI